MPGGEPEVRSEQSWMGDRDAVRLAVREETEDGRRPPEVNPGTPI